MNQQEDTSNYWRKLLRIDEPLAVGILDQFRYPHRLLRPLFFLIFNFFARIYNRIEVKGIENLPQNPPYIIAPNHCSAMDYPTVAWAIGRRNREDLYVLATKLYYDNLFARFFMKAGANVARIDTEEDFFPALRLAVKILQRGKSIYIQPEGTRSETGELLPFRVGVGVLAVEINVPIVPVYIDGTLKALKTGSIFPKPYKIRVFIGRPIDIAPYLEKRKTEKAYYVYKEVTGELQRRIQEMKDRAS